jgi:hypothetical protein
MLLKYGCQFRNDLQMDKICPSLNTSKSGLKHLIYITKQSLFISGLLVVNLFQPIMNKVTSTFNNFFKSSDFKIQHEFVPKTAKSNIISIFMGFKK